MPDAYTLGVEEELHVVDLATGRLSPRAPELLHGLPDAEFSVELQRTSLETNTPVATTLEGLRAQLVRLRGMADDVAAKVGLGVVAAGTAPVSSTADFELTALGRFSRMQQDYRYLVDDQLICGLQVHTGVADRDTAVRVAQRIAPDLPALLALSASSPYWNGVDTGYSSFRTMIWRRWPTAGSFSTGGTMETAEQYDRLVGDLIAAGVISDPKMAYFDVRPSAHVPTLELRVCDGCPLVDDAVLVAGLFRAVVDELLTAVLARGESASRQRARFAERGRLTDGVTLRGSETRGQVPQPLDPPRISAGYPDAPDDEALMLSGIPYPAYRPVFAVLDDLPPAELAARVQGVKATARADGLTYGIDGEQRPFPLDIVPRIVAAHEWSTLAAGLTQRARAIELFLRDIYGPARIIDDGLLDWATVHDSPGWNPAAALLPKGVVNAPVIGFDLVRDTLGGWRVLEDNCRVPSGVGYAIGVRTLMQSALPELAGDVALRDPRTALGLIGRTLRACTDRPDPVVALLSDGADNSAWYEHRMIATQAGFLLVEPSQLTLSRGQVLAAGRRVDVLYLRLGVELADLRTAQGEPIGAKILRAAQDGGVVLANAPGAGVADDKALYCVVPDMISYYLDERPLLLPVPTYRCANPDECGPVLDRLDQLVTKPVDGYGGGGVLIGPAASRAELDERRAAIEAAPSRWIAQEVVAMSTHPTLDPTCRTMQPRHVDLRAFVYLSGTGPGDVHLADLALTRMAPAGSMVVNSSRGGGAKDTWIIADRADITSGDGLLVGADRAENDDVYDFSR